MFQHYAPSSSALTCALLISSRLGSAAARSSASPPASSCWRGRWQVPEGGACDDAYLRQGGTTCLTILVYHFLAVVNNVASYGDP